MVVKIAVIGISASVHEAKKPSQRSPHQRAGSWFWHQQFRVTAYFEPFYRSPEVVDAQIHGTGLGLAVAKRIAEAMAEGLSVTSEVGMGSTFTLHFTGHFEIGCRSGIVCSGIDVGVHK